MGEAWWNENNVDRLKTMWNSGMSGTDIALAFGGGLSRNAVIGKIHRLKLVAREKGTNCARPAKQPKQPRKPRAVAPGGGRPRLPARSRAQNIMLKASGNDPGLAEKYAPPIIDIAIPFEQRRSILDLTNTTCRWPVGNPGEEGFFFCGAAGADLTDHRPYCPHHTARSRTAVVGPTRRQWRGPY